MAKTMSADKKPTLWLDAEVNVLIIGVDTHDGSDHPLWSPRNELPLNKALIQHIVDNGQLSPIQVRKANIKRGDADVYEVVAGVQRVRAIRALNRCSGYEVGHGLYRYVEAEVVEWATDYEPNNEER